MSFLSPPLFTIPINTNLSFKPTTKFQVVTRWLKGGDRNTRFFHQQASQRRRRNFISELQDDQGTAHSGDEAVGSLFVDYFTNLFQTSTPINFSTVLHGIEPVITTEMNSQLTRPFMRQEVDNAIKQMGSLKAPGPDGMSPIFYQTFGTL